MKQLEGVELFQKLQKRIIGRKKEIKNILAAIRVGRNMVLEGAPGTSKSTILREITQAINIPFYMIEGSAELTPAKLIGSHNPAEVMSSGYSADTFHRGPLTQAMVEGGFLYLEEFNRIPEDVMNVLIRAMDERKISIPRVGEIIAAPSFRLIAAMNPYDDVGTERISRAISDRFCRLVLQYQSEEEEIEVVKLKTGGDSFGLAPLAVNIARQTRVHPEVKMGSSVRGAIDMVLIAGELLVIDGIENKQAMIANYDLGAKESILDAALMALSSKIWLIETCEKTPEEIIREIWDSLHSIYLPTTPDGEKGPPKSGEEDPSGEGGKNPGQTGQRGEGEKDSFNAQDSTQGLAPNGEDGSVVQADQINGVSADASDKPVDMPLNSQDNITPLYPYIYHNNPYGDSDSIQAAKELALSWVLNVPKVYKISKVTYGDFKPSRYDFNSDELELDRTMDRILGKREIEYDDFIVRERKQERRAFSLIIDASGSMKGENILRAAIAVTTLVNNLGKDDYAIISFSEQARVIKFMNSHKDIRTLINDIFNSFIGGMTDIGTGLEIGLQELYRSNLKKKVGIILTDGAHNKRSDPLVQAKKYPKLSVIGIRPPWEDAEERCVQMAQLGRGRCIFVNEIYEIPKALTTCLADSFG
jgi:MoxR-like ATPase